MAVSTGTFMLSEFSSAWRLAGRSWLLDALQGSQPSPSVGSSQKSAQQQSVNIAVIPEPLEACREAARPNLTPVAAEDDIRLALPLQSEIIN